MDILLPKPKRQDKRNKNRKYGRKGRTAKHRLNQFCGLSNCTKLAASRYYDNDLKCYMVLYSNRQRERLQTP